MVKIVIDDRELEVKDGLTVLMAAKENGIDIPHFCFHPRLKISGNCRMCLVEIEKAPKLQIACGTIVSEGMIVKTKTEKVKKARQVVLEFFLINHPLDCPVCDESGECKLQDYCFDYGLSTSRFSEEKHTFDKIDLGTYVKREQNRCIHCTRCIRFMRDVAGSEQLGLSERGGHTVVGPYLQKALESLFSMNVVHVCPVGALTSKLSRFKARSWLMTSIRTVCDGCARGCNMLVWTYKNEIIRVTPAENKDVNLSWLCNRAHDIAAQFAAKVENTSSSCCCGNKATFEKAVSETANAILDVGNDKIAVIGSACLTVEENQAIRDFAEKYLPGSILSFYSGFKEDDRPFEPSYKPIDEWFIRADSTPNSQGVKKIIGESKSFKPLEVVKKTLEESKIKTVISFGFNGDAITGSDDIAKAINKAEFILDAEECPKTVETLNAKVSIPLKSHFEKSGTYINEGGVEQKIQPVIECLNKCEVIQITKALAKKLEVEIKGK